jgi:hypothetical protein
MHNHRRKNEEIANQVNSMPYTELTAGHEAYERAEDEFNKSRVPLYVIVGAAIVIAAINEAYIGSAVAFLMCLIFGGGTLFYLWLTRNNGPDLPKTSERSRTNKKKQ